MKFNIFRSILPILPIFLVYIFTDWLISLFHMFVFNSHDYISFNSPTLHLAKYFVIGILLVILGFRFITLTQFGKRFLYTLLTVCIAGFFITSLWFNAIDEDNVVAFRVFFSTNYSWDEVESLSTHVYRENRNLSDRRAGSGKSIVHKKYNFYFIDGKSINLWSNLDSVYELHSLVLEKDIDINHLTEAEYFDQRYSSYFNKKLDKAYVVFGIK